MKENTCKIVITWILLIACAIMLMISLQSCNSSTSPPQTPPVAVFPKGWKKMSTDSVKPTHFEAFIKDDSIFVKFVK